MDRQGQQRQCHQGLKGVSLEGAILDIVLLEDGQEQREVRELIRKGRRLRRQVSGSPG